MGEVISIWHGKKIRYQKAITKISIDVDKNAFYKLALAMKLGVFETKNANVVKEISFDNFSDADQSNLIVKVAPDSRVGVKLQTGEIVEFSNDFTSVNFKAVIDAKNEKYLINFNSFLSEIAGNEILTIAENISRLFVAGGVDVVLMRLHLQVNGYSTILRGYEDGEHLSLVMAVDDKDNPIIALDLIDMAIYEITSDANREEMCSVRDCVEFDYDSMLDAYIAVYKSLISLREEEDKGKPPLLRSFRFDASFYRTFSETIRARLAETDLDTFIKFCSATDMMIYERNEKGEFDYFEFEPHEDLSEMKNLFIRPSDGMELGINPKTGEIALILPKYDQDRRGKIDEKEIRYILRDFDQVLGSFFFEGDPVQIMANHYYDLTDTYDGFYDPDILYEQMGFKSWVAADQHYETDVGIEEPFYELKDESTVGFQSTYICALMDVDDEDLENVTYSLEDLKGDNAIDLLTSLKEKNIVYSVNKCKTIFRCSSLSSFHDQAQLKRFYLDLIGSFMSSLY